MSVGLYWRPMKPETEERLPLELRTTLEKRERFPLRVGGSHRLYFEGLAHGGVDGAERIVELIDQYGEIELFTAC